MPGQVKNYGDMKQAWATLSIDSLQLLTAMCMWEVLMAIFTVSVQHRATLAPGLCLKATRREPGQQQ